MESGPRAPPEKVSGTVAEMLVTLAGLRREGFFSSREEYLAICAARANLAMSRQVRVKYGRDWASGGHRIPNAFQDHGYPNAAQLGRDGATLRSSGVGTVAEQAQVNFRPSSIVHRPLSPSGTRESQGGVERTGASRPGRRGVRDGNGGGVAGKASAGKGRRLIRVRDPWGEAPGGKRTVKRRAEIGRKGTACMMRGVP